MMNRKRLLAFGMAVLMLSSSVSVSAATLKDVFDAEYYANNNDDLRDAFGYDEAALYQHYITYGLAEGRDFSPIIDVVEYREKYADLDAAFGNDWDAYVNHYFTYGIKEGRDNCADFAILQYVNGYSDIQTAFGDNYLAIAKHYLNYGMDEGRVAGSKQKTADALMKAWYEQQAIANANNSACMGNDAEDTEDVEDTEDTEDTAATTTRTETYDGWEYVYEISGGVDTSCTIYDPDGNFIMKELFTKNDEGKNTKVEWYDESGACTGWQTIIYNDDDSTTYVTYDEAGEISDIVTQMADGSFIYG